MKPILIYVDDEPHNLSVLEAACPDEWIVKTFDSPAKALEVLDSIKPHVIISDQRMPGMAGVQFLEIAKKIVPEAIRIIVTGYSDEDLIVESVRKAQIFDYIRKPWDVDDLISSLTRAFDFFNANAESRRLQNELLAREAELKEKNRSLTEAMKDVELSRFKETEMRTELECWVPPFVLWGLKNKTLESGSNCDLVGLAFDIIGSSRLHNVKVDGRPVRSLIIQNFSEAVLRNGGWRESHSGDSAYAHFGLTGDKEKASEAALAAAREFRVGLRSLSAATGVEIECGIALHIARQCPVYIHTVHLNTIRGPVTQKSFDTSSADVDLLHRIEKLVHQLPGSNIVMSRAFFDSLTQTPQGAVSIGEHEFAGQSQPVDLMLIASDRVREEDLMRLKHGTNQVVLAPVPKKDAA